MIEYRHLKKGKRGNKGWVYQWQPLSRHTDVQPHDFDYYELRIFGTVYNEYTPEFEQALNDVKLWKILSD